MSHSPVSLVVGGTSGIGAEVVRRLAGRGRHVVVSGSRIPAEAAPFLQEIEGATYVQADMSDPEAPVRLVAQIESELGRLDDVVYSAGATVAVPHADLDGVTDEVWERILGMNVVTPWRLVKAAAPLLRASGKGTVSFVGALSGADVGGSSIPYAVSKAALHHMVKLLGVVLGPDVRINAVAPGLIDTPWTSGDGFDALRSMWGGKAPLGRTGNPADVAEVILGFIDFGYVTGQTLVIDGGFSLVP
ncbi:SDR family NAD(P)-dependent oxidoreductase [Streptomyces sp. NPDC101455]|uniref:SDR family NAD(P)-dependent oxidoreductase n=1 Tax=Streptomyces sp. NPDC101455 TaxID=3366142 RepID=UPI003822D236